MNECCLDMTNRLKVRKIQRFKEILCSEYVYQSFKTYILLNGKSCDTVEYMQLSTMLANKTFQSTDAPLGYLVRCLFVCFGKRDIIRRFCHCQY